MKKLMIIITLLASFYLITSCKMTTDENAVYDIIIENNTSHTFSKVNIREHGQANWYLQKNMQLPQGQHTIFLSKKIEKDIKYDIQLETLAKETATHYDIFLSDDEIIPFDRLDVEDITSINILNKTSLDFAEVRIGRAGQPSYIFTRVINIPKDQPTNIANIAPVLDSSVLYWIQLRSGTLTAIQYNQALWQNKTIQFTNENIE
ncbi:MAG: hypothetical protein FWG20_06135 [Candidatus Cloacimonetes bacterium]|nr:hypothetical protein [Candidatus Cloacimonadota bacterium]